MNKLWQNKWLLLIIAVAIFLYTYNLRATQAFVSDTARDTLHMLQLWQDKEITLLGPPLSLGLGSTKEVYFSSVSLYFGMLGLFLTNFDPVGAAIPGIILSVLSIPALYLFLKSVGKSERLAIIGTMLYAWSPAIVHHARFFWNPNPILPLGVFFWLSFEYSQKLAWGYKKMSLSLLCGIILGLMFDFHYLGIIGGVLSAIYLLLSKEYRALIAYLFGGIIGAFPMIIFELRNHFFLSKNILWNITNHGVALDLAARKNPVVDIAAPWLSILGVTPTELPYPTIFTLSTLLLLMLATGIIFWQICVARRIWKSNNHFHYLIFILTSIVLLALAQNSVNTRYVWGIYPLIIWLFADGISRFKNQSILIILAIFIVANSVVNITSPRNLSKQIIPLNDLEEVGKIIAGEHNTGSYNLSDSVTGDARGVSLRYYVQRDSQIKPLNMNSYQNLDILYVFAPNVETILAGNRYEFTATPNLKLERSWTIGSNYLYKFVRSNLPK